jgi:protein O-GlcNAc transferase
VKNKISKSQIASLYKQCLEFHQAGKIAAAEQLYLRLLSAAPKDPEIVRHFGILRFQQGNYAEAVKILERACLAHPKSAELQYSLGNILLQLGRPADAESRFRACLAVAPDFPDAIANLGATLRVLGRNTEAIGYLQRAAALLPRSVGPLANLSCVLLFMNRYDAAEKVLQRVVEVAPHDHEQLALLAETQYRIGKLSDAISNFRKILALNPNNLSAQSVLLRSNLRICDWTDLEALRTHFTSGLRRADGKGRAGTPSPYTSLLVCDDPADCLTVARIRALEASSESQSLNTKPRIAKVRDKIKVAYLSADYREHATSYLVSELIETHDRDAFEVIGLSFGPNDESPMRRRMERAFDRFEDVIELSPSAIAKRLADLSIDVAVDLQGFNQYGRMEIFAHRAAPVQVLYLGWPGTTGAGFYDYVLADPIVLPKENFEYFSEQVVWLPNCYQPNDRQRKIAAISTSRSDCQLPENGIVFCCFNNTFKILPEIFDIWMRLLRQVPGSVLWLIQGDETGRQNLRREANARGIDESRLVFAPRLPNDQHLARIANADLFLDTFPYNAHTTASDALWQGVPVLTCTGRTFPSRVATSLLHNVGLSEFAVESFFDYERLALRLAQDPASLQAVRKQLLDRRSTAPLFDVQKLARDIETAYREMVRRSDRGVAPQFFDVAALEAPSSH